MESVKKKSNYVVILRKSEWDDIHYYFDCVEKITDNTCVTKGKNYGKSIRPKLELGYDAYNRLLRTLGEVKGGMYKDKTVGPVICIPFLDPKDKSSDFLIYELSDELLSKTLGGRYCTEEELFNILNKLFTNISRFAKGTSISGSSYLYCYFDKEYKDTMKVVNRNNLNYATKKQSNSKAEEGNNLDYSTEKQSDSKAEVVVDINKFKPDEIISTLKKKIIGQDAAVSDVVETFLLNQLVIDMNDSEVLKTSKGNILLDGPTGTGKTFMIKEISSILELPMVVVSAPSFSPAGYKGNNLDTILVSLLDRANGNLELAQKGVIAFDEFDKLGHSNDSSKGLELRLALQEELLTYISGSTFDIDYHGQHIAFDTSKITFVGMGAFTKLRESKINDNEASKNMIGFYNESEQPSAIKQKTISIDPDDYVNVGLARELVGRFTTLTHTDPIDKDGMIRIMKESQTSPLLFVKKLAMNMGKELIISDDVIEHIAEQAMELNTGARALQTIFSPIQRKITRQLMSDEILKIEVTKEMVASLDNIKSRRY